MQILFIRVAMESSFSGWGIGVVFFRQLIIRVFKLFDMDVCIVICECLGVDLGDEDLCMYVSRRESIRGKCYRKHVHVYFCPGILGVRI